MRFSVDPWDVDYGSSDQLQVDQSSAEVAVDTEMPATDWRALSSPVRPATKCVTFVDGVRRIDARVWIDDDSGEVYPGLCASFAAGAARCDARATITDVDIARGLFSAAPSAQDINTTSAQYPARMAASSNLESLMLAVHERMTQTEVEIAETASRDTDIDLIVIDGPLRGRQHLTRTVGFIKSHSVRYLPDVLHRMVSSLRDGERTPVFTIGTSWSRHSWYIRLPGTEGSRWAGVVRCECSSDLKPVDAVALAHETTALLPRFASEPHKDTRAPQNLYPIGGLERELRRRLGDQGLLYRGLRREAASGGGVKRLGVTDA